VEKAMNISRIYIGGWFQRTTLHLSELFDFLKYGTTSLALDMAQVKVLQQKLDLVLVTLSVGDGLEYITATTHSGITIKIVEDGLMVLSLSSSHEATLKSDIVSLTDYYEKKLSPAFSYIFSLGAPVPKELANIATVYPYFVVLHKEKRDSVDKLLTLFGETLHFEMKNPIADIYRGDKLYIINNRTDKNESIERYVEEQIFMREFKGQLHRYLYLHRTIWEKISEVKEKGKMKGKEIGAFKDKIDGYAKTINLIEARIAQMGSYLKTRERISKSDKALSAFSGLVEYRYEALADTLDYIKHIWTMTKNYVNRAIDIFKTLQDQATQNSIKTLRLLVLLELVRLCLGSSSRLQLFRSAVSCTLLVLWYWLFLLSGCLNSLINIKHSK
jgi:hypothetical protein